MEDKKIYLWTLIGILGITIIVIFILLVNQTKEVNKLKKEMAEKEKHATTEIEKLKLKLAEKEEETSARMEELKRRATEINAKRIAEIKNLERRLGEEKEKLERRLAEEKEKLERQLAEEKEKLERQLAEEKEKLERQLAEEKEKEEKKKNAWQEIIITDFYYSNPLLTGGITLEWIELYNPTSYTFLDIKYEFYDANDNVVKIKGTISGPLPSHTTKKFNIGRWTEGLWEHKYGIRIVGAKAIE